FIDDPDDVGFTSETLAVFRSAPSGLTCLLGFTTLVDRACGFVVGRGRDAFDRVRLESRCDFEDIPCAPGGELCAETLLILPTDDPWRAGEAWAACVAHRYRPTFPAGALVGWSDWQYYRREIAEADVLENVDVLHRGRCPVEYVLVDDGYQRNMSDWLVANERFGHGIAWLAERIREKGFKPGIWIAPLTAHESSALVREHPDWLVRDAAGRVLAHHTHMGTVHALDFTVPAAADWLRALVRTLTRDFGYRWIKLDGPIRRYTAGAVFRNRTITSVQHIRLALGIIREAAGDAVVEGEGYYGPSIGLVDTQRVTQDVQQAWPRLRHTAQVNLLSTFMHRRWWINNPDAFILRDTPTPHYAPDGRPEDVMSTDELQTEITALALTGGVVMLTDRMAHLAEDRRALVDAFIPVYSNAARPVDLFNGRTCPEIFHQEVRTDAEHYDVIAVFNWEDGPREMSVDLGAIALAGEAPCAAFEFWTQTFVGVVADSLDVGKVPAHGVRVVALRPMRGHPFVMGTSVHVTQGGVELRETRWDDARCVLSGRVSSWSSRGAAVHVCVPDGYVHAHARGNHLAVGTAAGREVAFEAGFRRE
ncbi:MAG TPA: alpha-galactosidase, partial [Planctomycetota bacterium]|nr:alpha-galactosidase [Planctomycetota bacterium]